MRWLIHCAKGISYPCYPFEDVLARGELGPAGPSTNPCYGIRRYAEVERECFLSDVELTALGSELARMDEESTSPAAVTTLSGFLP